MNLTSDIIIAFVAMLHLYFLILEMFLWDKPIGLRTFGLSWEMANSTKVLAANQGLYNGFLAAGLAWGLILGTAGIYIKAFFLGCVIVAGIFGAISVNIKILYVQAVPAIIGLSLLLLI